MDAEKLHYLSPFIRLVKISRSQQLLGEWIDFDHVFTYIEQGEAEFIIDGMRYQLKSGDVLIIPPLMVHLIHATSKTPLIQYIVHFDLHSSEQRRKWDQISITLPEHKMLPHSEKLFLTIDYVSHIHPSDQPYLQQRFLKLLELYTTKPTFNDFQMKGIFIDLLALFFRNQAQAKASLGKQTRGWASIELSIHYIHANYHLPNLDRITIANHVGLSSNHLSFLFKEQLGTSIHKYVTFIRIEQAKKKILTQENSLTVIAKEVGFSSIYSFSRAFKSVIGMSATQFSSMHASRRSVSNTTIS